MARIRAEIKRGFLRTLWRAAAKISASLDESLESFQDNLSEGVKTGRILISTSGGGYSTSFDSPFPSREITQEEIFAFSEEILAIRDDARTALTDAGADATDDGAVVAQMLLDDRMQTVRSYMGDFTAIRFPTYGPTR